MLSFCSVDVYVPRGTQFGSRGARSLEFTEAVTFAAELERPEYACDATCALVTVEDGAKHSV